MKKKRLAVLSLLGVLAFGGLAITSLTGCGSQETEDTTEGNDGTTNEEDTAGGTTTEEPTTGEENTDDETKTDDSETGGSEGGNTGGSEGGDSETDDEDGAYIKDGSFELSGASEELLSRYWTETGADGSTTNWDQDTSEGEYSFNKYWESASSETYTLAQTSTFTVTKEDIYILSYSLMGSDVLDITVGIYEENGNEVVTSSNYSGWTETVADRYNELTVSLSADTNYLFKLTLTNIAEGTWFTLDDITLEKYVEPVEITGETTTYAGSPVTLTANKDVTWSIEEGSSYATLSNETLRSVTVETNENTPDSTTVTIKATSITEGEEDNAVTHSITVYELSEELSVTPNKTKIYDGHSVTFTANAEVSYSVADLEASQYEINGSEITFTLGLDEYGQTKEVDVTASDGTNDVTTTITVYSTTITNNGTFDYQEDNVWDIQEYEGWTVGGYAADNDQTFYLKGSSDSNAGKIVYDYTNSTGETVTNDTCVYFEFELIEDTTIKYEVLWSNSGDIWGDARFYNADTLEKLNSSTIWSGNDSTITLEAGSYQFGYYMSEDGQEWSKGNSSWIGIDTLLLTVD